MHILVTGANGQLGRELRTVSRYSTHKFTFTDIMHADGMEISVLDITDKDRVFQFVKENGVDVIVNCAAYTNVDKAESEIGLCWKLNADAPKMLAHVAGSNNALLIHISTDYVFNDASYNSPIRETDSPECMFGVYGVTKLAGEQGVVEAGAKHVIIRTSWLYSEYGRNFCRTMMRLTSEKTEISVVADQTGTPTYAYDLANAILDVINDYGHGGISAQSYAKSGVYHFSNEGSCSWYDFAEHICRLSGNECRITPCRTEDYPSTAKRPVYSVLDKTKIKAAFGVSVPYWTDSLSNCIKNLLDSESAEKPCAYTRNIMVTGGLGFIGSHVVRHFVRKYPKYKIVNVDKMTYAGNPLNLSDIKDEPNYVFVKADITDADAMRGIMKDYGIDGIIHLAAESHVDRSIEDPSVFARTNIMGTLNLLEAAKEYWDTLPEKYEGKKFYHISTDEVYGSLEVDKPEGVKPPFSTKASSKATMAYGTRFFTENTKYDPHSPYSASKASSDHLVRSYHDTYGLPTVITNCSNNYGPNQFPEKLIPLFIRNVIERKPLPVYGNGGNIRDWLYVGDHVRAIDLVFHKGKPSETYNVGGFNEWKNIDIVKVIVKTVDRMLGREECEDMNLITFVNDRPGHDARYAIDSTKIQRELGWEPKVQFEEGIEMTVDWYLSNPEWQRNTISGEYQNECQTKTE